MDRETGIDPRGNTGEQSSTCACIDGDSDSGCCSYFRRQWSLFPSSPLLCSRAAIDRSSSSRGRREAVESEMQRWKQCKKQRERKTGDRRQQ